jgi:hypothetical protein
MTAVPDAAAPDETNLGELQQEFRPMAATVFAAIIIGALLIIGGLTAFFFIGRAIYLSSGNLPAFAKVGASWASTAGFSLVALGLGVGGFFLIRYAQALATHRVSIYSGGYLYSWSGKVDVVCWDEVEVITETVTYQRLPLVKGPAQYLIPKSANVFYSIMRKGGAVHTFDGDSVQKFKTFGKLLRQTAQEKGIPWKTEERQ